MYFVADRLAAVHLLHQIKLGLMLSIVMAYVSTFLSGASLMNISLSCFNEFYGSNTKHIKLTISCLAFQVEGKGLVVCCHIKHSEQLVYAGSFSKKKITIKNYDSFSPSTFSPPLRVFKGKLKHPVERECLTSSL